MSAPTDKATSFDEAIRHIRAESAVWVRMAAVLRDDGKWYARLVELTTGSAPPSWTLMEWNYSRALFAAVLETGASVAEWLPGGLVTLSCREIVLPQADSTLRWERHQSRAPASLEALEWPSVETRIAFVDSQSEPNERLVSASGAPSFVNFHTAAARFFYLDGQPRGGSLPREVIYRHQDLRGRLASVHIADGEALVSVEGDDIAGMQVELAGDAPGPTLPISGQRPGGETVAFSLPGGLPPGAWILLKNGSEWVDTRFLTRPWMSIAEASVEVVEPRTRLEVFLANREGPGVEFKRSVPETEEAKWKAMKTVCAFANGPGGSILFGVGDDGDVPGLPVATIHRVRDQLTQIVDSWVQPSPAVDFEVLPLDNEHVAVLELRVAPGPELHGSRGRRNEEAVVYVRHFATSVRARPREIEGIVRGLAPVGLPWRPGI
jgi:hypothetical protein